MLRVFIKFSLLFIFAFYSTVQSDASKILCVSVALSPSHVIHHEALVRGLAAKGHNVMYYSLTFMDVCVIHKFAFYR